MDRSRFYFDFSIDLRSERDKSVYFWLCGCYLFYNATITRENSNNSPLSEKNCFCHFFFSTTSAIITHEKSYERSATSIYSVVKLNLYRLSVCCRNTLSRWRQIISAVRRFFDVTARYIAPRFTKLEMRSLCGQ